MKIGAIIQINSKAGLGYFINNSFALDCRTSDPTLILAYFFSQNVDMSYIYFLFFLSNKNYKKYFRHKTDKDTYKQASLF